ncbi:MAG TPA: paraquat-inducible protein B [Nitrospiraceae bacterium]|jgi:paraquat-inducible protein B|nr:paraquat-inducible protein B [Nitrospiraceae bacterium]
MSKKASKTLIGAFVIGAIALAVVCVVVFGSGKFFKKTLHFVMFFEGSVKGLQVGAPVVFRGVKIGQVTDIKLEFNPKELAFFIPVYVEFDPESLVIFGADRTIHAKRYQFINALIEKGLRAQLQLQSFVTGQLQVSIDLFPDKPIRLVGAEKKYHEIPTIPTPMEELTKKLEDLHIEELATNLKSTVAGIDKFINSPELKESVVSLNQALKGVDKLVRNLDTRTEPMLSSIKSASDAATATLVQAKETLAMDKGVPGEIASNINDTLKASRNTLDATQKAIAGVQQIAAQNANIGYEIDRSLEQMTALARSLRSLTDYLDRHPEALVRGKTPSKGE